MNAAAQPSIRSHTMPDKTFGDFTSRPIKTFPNVESNLGTAYADGEITDRIQQDHEAPSMTSMKS